MCFYHKQIGDIKYCICLPIICGVVTIAVFDLLSLWVNMQFMDL